MTGRHPFAIEGPGMLYSTAQLSRFSAEFGDSRPNARSDASVIGHHLRAMHALPTYFRKAARGVLRSLPRSMTAARGYAFCDTLETGFCSLRGHTGPLALLKQLAARQ